MLIYSLITSLTIILSKGKQKERTIKEILYYLSKKQRTKIINVIYRRKIELFKRNEIFIFYFKSYYNIMLGRGI
ncbi:MAG TPA: hypothetical protein DIT08_05425 [Enterococcus sp.]|nr:hypothetical protein [Enterococcus sp.]